MNLRFIVSSPKVFRLRHQACRRVLRRNGGLSLLEVLLALAILGGALAAIGELVRVGARSAEAARDQTTAQMLAETTMSEIVMGMIPAESVSQTPVADPNYQLEWSYSIVIEQVDQEGLIAVYLTVTQNSELTSRPVNFTLVRWMVDPASETVEDTEVAL